MTPKVTVLMPMYNAERYVEQTIVSIQRQTLQDFEFIIVDDGSTDASRRIVERCARQDARLHLITQQNRGIVSALNAGLRRVRTPYVARIDSDDTCDERRLELQWSRLEADRDLVVLGSNSIVTDPQGNRLGTFSVPLTHEAIESAHLQGWSSIHHPSAMIRTDALKRVGGYREGYCPAEDLDLWIRLAEIGKVANHPEPLLTRRLTVDGLVASRSAEQEATIRRILIETWTRRGLAGVPRCPRVRASTTAGLYRSWAWIAIADGQMAMARRYAREAIVREPFRPNGWRLFVVTRGGTFAAAWWWRAHWNRLCRSREPASEACSVSCSVALNDREKLAVER
jgi:glycosyltransferase involved in cell wall biosynthesis